MKHTAKKVYAGCYIYRGYDIERMEDGHWNLKNEGTDFWTDGSATLGDAKAMIDRWLDHPRG